MPLKNMEADFNYLFKLILIGDSGVGKTSLIKRYTDKIFLESYVSTIGVDFKIKTVKIKNDVVKLQIWDTAGQERFRSIINSYYRGSHAVVVVFDLCDIESFLNLENWVTEINANASEKAIRLFIGNKCDMQADVVVSEDQVREFLKKHKMDNCKVWFVSAKEDVKVADFFEDLANMLVENEKKFGPIFTKSKDTIKLQGLEDGGKSKFGCC